MRQYNFVHLHQNRLGFSAGTRPWVLGKPQGYLPDKHEIMKHFESIAAAVATEHRVDLVELFGYRYTGHRTSGSKVLASARYAPTVPAGARAGVKQPAAEFEIVASRLIDARGFDVKIKKPLAVSAGAAVNSISVVDVLTPETTVSMRFGPGAASEIWVVGSGKTAMDTVYHLVNRVPGVAARLRSVARDLSSGRESFLIAQPSARIPLVWSLGSVFKARLSLLARWYTSDRGQDSDGPWALVPKP